jgi:hypothetical protein
VELETIVLFLFSGRSRTRDLPSSLISFTGKIDKVTIDLKEMKKAEEAEENKLRAEAAYRRAMSD